MTPLRSGDKCRVNARAYFWVGSVVTIIDPDAPLHYVRATIGNDGPVMSFLASELDPEAAPAPTQESA